VGAPPPHTVGLRHWTIELASHDEVAEVRARLEAAGTAVEPVDGGLLVRDPWQTGLAVVVR
jgi:hypothetical protein